MKLSSATGCYRILMFLGLCDENHVVPPKWPARHKISGILHVPYAKIKEPFTVYHDSELNRSRIDYYNGMAKTIQIGGHKNSSAGSLGRGYKILFITTDKVLNQRTCFGLNGTKKDPIHVQTVLPKMDQFQLIGRDEYNGRECLVWKNETIHGRKTNTYTMWTDASNNEPVLYEMLGYDVVLSSHYDKYAIEMLDVDFSPDAFDDKVFKIYKKYKRCHRFTGAGERSRMGFFDGAHINPMQEFTHIGESKHHDKSYKKFRQKHNKHYSDAKEARNRKHIFNQNIRFINSHNRAGHKYKLAMNHMSDWSDEDTLRLLGHKSRSTRMATAKLIPALPFDKTAFPDREIPRHVDWSEHGAVNDVKDQAICGSCWSFGATASIEGAYFLKTGKLVQLSEQELVDCSWGAGNNGCDGGDAFRAFDWILTHGGLTFSRDYGPYLGIDGFCNSRLDTEKVKIRHYVNVTSNDTEALKLALVYNGPIAVSMFVDTKTFRYYASGIYYNPDCKQQLDDLNHAVLLVGFGHHKGEGYWIIKNSWSTYWGESGYFKISQRNNNCGVATNPAYVIL